MAKDETKVFPKNALTLLSKQMVSIESTFSDDFYDLVSKIVESKSKLVFCGIGKSGHIAKKVAASFTSTSFRAVYLDTVDAQHGDLGIVQSGDIVFLLSNSGSTKELLELELFLKEHGAITVSVTSKPESKLAQKTDYHLCTHVEKELCPLNLAPTLSTTITLIILDILMGCCMVEKGVTPTQYAKSHPAGALGRRLLLRVSNIMHATTAHVFEGDSFEVVLEKITRESKGLIPVYDSSTSVVGAITDGDVRRAVKSFKAKVFDVTAKEMMTSNPKTIQSDVKATEALELMEEHNITALLVFKDDAFVGILHIHDILDSL